LVFPPTPPFARTPPAPDFPPLIAPSSSSSPQALSRSAQIPKHRPSFFQVAIQTSERKFSTAVVESQAQPSLFLDVNALAPKHARARISSLLLQRLPVSNLHHVEHVSRRLNCCGASAFAAVLVASVRRRSRESA
jgi:hypothetical protein